MIELRHVEFIFKIRRRTQTADDRLRLKRTRTIDQQAFKRAHLHIWDMRTRRADELDRKSVV